MGWLGGGRRRGQKLPAAVVRSHGEESAEGGKATAAGRPRPQYALHANYREICLWQFLHPLVGRTWTIGDRATASQLLTCPPPLCRGGYRMAWPCGKSCQKNDSEHHPSLLGPVYLPLGHGFSPPSPFLSTPTCPHPQEILIQRHAYDLSQMGPTHIWAAPPEMPLNSLEWVHHHGATLRAKFHRCNHEPCLCLQRWRVQFKTELGQEGHARESVQQEVSDALLWNIIWHQQDPKCLQQF